MKKKILALILAAVVFNTGIYYPADSYAYEGVDAVSAQMEDGTTGKNSEQASDHTETQDLQNPQEKDHQVQNQDGQESDDGSQIQPVSEEQDQETGIETEVETQAEKTSVSYRTHVQTYGWQDYVKDGETSGTSGQSKRLEGIQIKLEHPEYTGDIEYRTHVQTYGWQGYVKNGAMSGTSGQSKRLEAIQIRLTGEIAQHYDIYYRVHSQTYGWLDWAKNGEYAGTAGYSKRLEAIEIRLIEKGGAAPGPTEKKYLHPIWKNAESITKSHGGMDYLIFRKFFDCVKTGKRPPIDIYDAVAWMCITPLSEESIATGREVYIPDFTRGRWMTREFEEL